MDLAEISYKQALIDLDFANARIVDLSCRIDVTAAELIVLREQYETLKAGSVTAAPAASAAPSRRPLAFLHDLRRKKILFHIDEVCGAPLVSGKDGAKHVVSRREAKVITISGWAVPKNFPGPLAAVDVVLTGTDHSFSSRVSTFARQDVAAHFRNPSLERSGFRFQVGSATLQPGSYIVELRGQTPGGDTVATRAFSIELH